jgi:hypothetical protein
MARYGLSKARRRVGMEAQWRKAAQPTGGCARSTWRRPRGLLTFRTVAGARRMNQRSQARVGVHVRRVRRSADVAGCARSAGDDALSRSGSGTKRGGHV